MMISIFLLPGNVVCDLAGMPPSSEHHQMLRSFINMMVWSAAAIGAALSI